jgi:hypothetical protein
MTASEFAFLALGLVLGVATGSALIMVVGSRPPAREVRLTVERDAVPRRAATLSSDAFITATAEPARGGPADRRRLDRDLPPADPPADPSTPGSTAAFGPIMASNNRTVVSFDSPPLASAAIHVAPERDPALDTLRVQAALAAERLYRTGMPTATALLEARGEQAAPAPIGPAPVAPPRSAPALEPEPAAEPEPDADAATPAFVRILRGDHRALFAATAILAVDDEAERRPWHGALMGFASAVAEGAIGAGWLDVPVGNPFWDTFTLSQCRTIAASLASTGHRFDGIDGWADGRIPTYRDLTMAVASAGLEPRRIRAWPTQEEIAGLYREVTVASDDFLMSHAPELDLEEVRAIVGTAGPELDRLWSAWDRVRATLLEPLPAR